MIVPLALTIYFSTLNYDLLGTGPRKFVGLLNYRFFLTDPGLLPAFFNTFLLVIGVLLITAVGGVLLSLLLNQEIYGRNVLRTVIVAPFFIMPTVAALVWKNLIMNPTNGILAYLVSSLGFHPIDWFANAPLFSIVIIVAWQWLPFATLIILTALQSLDEEQLEAAELDGAKSVAKFFYITLPHISRAIAVLVMIETIFLLSIFAEILVTTNGGPGTATTNLTYLIYSQALLQFDIGGASAGGIVAVVVANVIALVLVRMVGKNLDAQ
ncbi:carbohydrate ABC transporter permease [Burkholderia aenigmatica]|nr:sugar ABC transporter permease [Burkholderia aenigmatica]